MPGYTLVKTELAEQPKRRRQALLAFQALLLRRLLNHRYVVDIMVHYNRIVGVYHCYLPLIH